MTEFQFIVSSNTAIRNSGAVEVDKFSEAVVAVSDYMTDTNMPIAAGDRISVGVRGFPPVNFVCNGHTTLDDGKVIPTWKQFSQQ